MLAPADPSGPAAGGSRAVLWGALAVALVALNLRGPLVALPSVTASARADLAVGPGAIGLLTTLPVLCFGLAAPLASGVIARAGLHRSVMLTLAGVVVGTLVRSAGGYPAAVAGTLVLGVAITVGNIALPVLIGEDFPTAVGLVTALYTAALNIGSTVTSAVTPVVAAATGWRAALLVWGALAVLAGAAALAEQRGRREPARRRRPQGAAGAPRARRPGRSVWRRAGTWGLLLAFGGQAFSYYGATAWLPELLREEQGMTQAAAGASAAVFQLTAVAGAFCVPLLLRATGRPRLVLWCVCAAWAALPAGLLAAPAAWGLWCALAGAAQGGGITTIFVAVVDRSDGVDDGRRLSAAVQGGGYVIGALGPLVVGAAHDATGGWTGPLLVVAVAIGLMLVAGSLVLPGRRAPTVGR